MEYPEFVTDTNGVTYHLASQPVRKGPHTSPAIYRNAEHDTFTPCADYMLALERGEVPPAPIMFRIFR